MDHDDISMIPGWWRVVYVCLTKCLVNMLGSISAPPAYAAEPTSSSKSVGRISATNSASSSIHVTAGMIHIHGFEVMDRAEHWSMHRNGDMGFILSCGVASRKSDDGFESVPKIRGWSMSVVLHGGLYCFLLPALVLMLCFKEDLPSSSSRLKAHFVGMGYSVTLADKVIKEHGQRDENLILEALFGYTDPSPIVREMYYSSNEEEDESPITDDGDDDADEEQSFLNRPVRTWTNFMDNDVLM